jgi:hypothetical protein
MLSRQRVKTITYVVELMSFVQDRIRRHGAAPDFPECLRREHFRSADLVQDLTLGRSPDFYGCAFPLWPLSLPHNPSITSAVVLIRPISS